MTSNARRLTALCSALVAMLASGCASGTLPGAVGAYEPAMAESYKLGPGDKVRVTVFGEQELSGEFLVSSQGMIALPLIGEVKAGGQTLDGLRSTVEQQLIASDMVRTPRVSADVTAYRPFYILGEVSTPGQYPYAIGMTVTKAVATAGGFTYRANPTVVYVTREGGTHEQELRVTAATWIGPGDTIRVGERTF